MTPTQEPQDSPGSAPDRIMARLRLKASGQAPLLLVTGACFAVFSIAAPHVFPTALSLQSMAFQLPEIGILAIAQMVAMVAAGIDLSVVAIAAVSGLSAAQFLHAVGAGDGMDSWPLTVVALLIALAVGAACGVINGLLIGKVGITPILATLATGSLFSGIAIVWTGGTSVVGFPASFRALGQTIPSGIPIPLLVFALAAIAAAIVLTRTVLGLQIGLVGANLSAARFSGIRLLRVIVSTYAMSGLLAAIAGIVIVTRTSSASPTYGQSYILITVVIAVLGGTDLAGGFGSVAGVTLAAVLLVIVQAGFSTLGINQFLYLVAQGLLLAGVLALKAAIGSAPPRWVPTLLRRRRPGGIDPHQPDESGTTEGNS